VRLRNFLFLKDVFILACTAFGGPQVHISMFLKKLVISRRYLSEDEFLEINALCNVLPGPTSTQTITAIGYRQGGPLVALMTLLLWALPASILITLLVLGFTIFSIEDLSFTKFIIPMAIGFILGGAFSVGKSVINDKLSFILFICATIAGIVFTSPWVYPLIIVSGAVAANIFIKGYNFEPLTGVKIKWQYIITFFGILILAAIMGKILQYRIILLFENIYRFGSLVYGGGNVLVPLMYEQFVNFKHYMSPQEFSIGFGLVQALPGPIFTLGTFTAGMSMQPYGLWAQLAGCLIGMVAIFLPGALLIFFFYPIWQQVKKYPIFKKSVKGSNAVSIGLILSAAFLLAKPLLINQGMQIQNAIVIALTFFMVAFTRIPSPIIVLTAIILGFIF
jgi:chromate transporter